MQDHPRSPRTDTSRALEEGLLRLQEAVPHLYGLVLSASDDREPRLTVLLAKGPDVAGAGDTPTFPASAHPALAAALRSRNPALWTGGGQGSGADGVLDALLPIEGLRTYLVAPMAAQGEVRGLLVLAWEGRRDHDPQLLTTAALWSGMLARAAQRRDAEAGRAATLTRLQFDEIAGGTELVDLLPKLPSKGLERAIHRARRAAATRANVMITGATGTGKLVLARLIHRWSAHPDAPLALLRCAGRDGSALHRVLLGDSERPSVVDLAAGGTLVIADVECLPTSTQDALGARLADVLPTDASGEVAARVVVTSTRDLAEETRAGRFSEALFDNISLGALRLPSLAEEAAQLLPIAEVILAHAATLQRHPLAPLDAAARARLLDRDWPGNLRELFVVLTRAAGAEPSRPIGPEALAPYAVSDSAARGFHVAGLLSMDDLQRAYIEHVLEYTEGKVHGPAGAAEVLGMKSATLQSRMNKLGVKGRRRRRGRPPARSRS